MKNEFENEELSSGNLASSVLWEKGCGGYAKKALSFDRNSNLR